MRRQHTFTDRRGLSLIEVLVAFFILAVGIVGVISLFPVGVQQVREAVFDTRSTIVALNAESTLEMFDWGNDPYLLQPPIAMENPFGPTALGATAPVHPAAMTFSLGQSSYASMTRYDGTRGTALGPGPGFPVYVDPVLANADEFAIPGVIYKQVPIQTTAGPYASTGTLADLSTSYLDLPIYTVSDAQLMPVSIDGTSATQINRRDSFLRHWFFSDGDMPFEEQNPVIPRNPSRGFNGSNGDACLPWEYYQTTLPPLVSSAVNTDQARPTCERESLYSWAFSVDRRPLVDNGSGDIIPSSNWKDFVRILVFYKRNFADPYRLARGCFFNGSNVATICWPVDSAGRKEITRPAIRRGTWLMEYTNTGASRTTATIRHRQRIVFHRIANFEDPFKDPSGNNWIQTVTLEDPISDSDFPFHSLGNLRPLPDRFTTPNPDNANGTIVPAASGPAYFGTAQTPPVVPNNTHIWVPVIFWDGLIEVFDMED